MNPLQGSLSSLSFTDIYGLSTTTPPDPAMLDLHRRVDKILNNAQVVWMLVPLQMIYSEVHNFL